MWRWGEEGEWVEGGGRGQGDYIPIDTPEVTLGNSFMTTHIASASKKKLYKKKKIIPPKNHFNRDGSHFFYPRRTRLVCDVRVTSEYVLQRYGGCFYSHVLVPKSFGGQ